MTGRSPNHLDCLDRSFRTLQPVSSAGNAEDTADYDLEYLARDVRART